MPPTNPLTLAWPGAPNPTRWSHKSRANRQIVGPPTARRAQPHPVVPQKPSKPPDRRTTVGLVADFPEAEAMRWRELAGESAIVRS